MRRTRRSSTGGRWPSNSSGANIYDDFTLENHGIVHPDYMTTFSLAAGCATDFRMSGRREPEAVMHNVGGIYENLKWFVLPDGGFVYPSGQDWQLFRNADWLRCHVLMSVLARDPDGWELGRRSLAALQKMQSRSESGAVYLPEETFFASSHSDLLRGLAESWLMLCWAEDLPRSSNRDWACGGWRPPDRPPSHGGCGQLAELGQWPDSTKRGQRPRPVVSPHPRNGVGAIRLAGTQIAPCRSGCNRSSTRKADGFVADVVAEHGRSLSGRTAIPVARRRPLEHERTADRGPRIDRGNRHRQSASSTIRNGFMNAATARSRSMARQPRCARGAARPARTGVKEASIDGRLNVQSSQPLAIRYAARRADYERSRVTDELRKLNYLGGERGYRAPARRFRLCRNTHAQGCRALSPQRSG